MELGLHHSGNCRRGEFDIAFAWIGDVVQCYFGYDSDGRIICRIAALAGVYDV